MVVHGPFPTGEPRVAREVHVARDEGFEVDVIATRRQGERAIEAGDGVRIIRLPLSHRRGGGVLRALLEYGGYTLAASLVVAALSVRRRYSVVHVNNPPDFLIAAALVPKLLGARVIFDIHDLSPDMFAMRFGGGVGTEAADRVLRLVERWAARLADVVLTVHDPYRRELTARGVAAGKTQVVMNSVDERLLPDGAPRADADEFRVVYHGSITPHYGLELLVEAAARAAAEVTDLRLDVYGEGDSLPAARARAAHLGIDDRVHFSGEYLPHVEVLREVSGASVGVVPNLPTRLNRFALSSKLFEYVALGIPVVCSDLPTLREHFSESEVLFFRAGDPAALADALIQTWRSPGEAHARARAARARYEHYRWAVHARRYAAVLTESCRRARLR
jgi:glycosyltransferase involved in cell wall biosynthesis